MKSHCKRGHPRNKDSVDSQGHCILCNRATALAWVKHHPRENRIRSLRYSAKVKAQVLTKYGHKGTLRCCWKNCRVSDVDMLTLDHKHNDGGKHRLLLKTKGGLAVYRYALRNDCHDTLQTLCANRQLKKAIRTAKTNRTD